MATLECLACGHVNPAGEASCGGCSASLQLQLCAACEAINADDARRCHSCGAPFGAENAVMPAGRRLMAAWVISGEPAASRKASLSAAMWLVPIFAAAGLSFHLYGTADSARAPIIEHAHAAPAPPPVTETVEPLAVSIELKHAPVEAPFEPKMTPFAKVGAPEGDVPRVTHTRGMPAQPVPVGADSDAATGASVPKGCPASVSALKLCDSR
jgi:hypothetical protein